MLAMFPDSTNSSENCKVNSSMEKSNNNSELQEGDSNVFNIPFLNVSEQHFDPIPVEDVCYNECEKCKVLQLELDRKEKISSCLKQKLCDFNHIMKANKCKEEMCKELTAMNQNVEKAKSELLSKNMELESMCLDLENKLSESLQDKLKVQQSVDTMNLDIETCKKDREEFALKNEQLEKELIQYKTLTVQRMTVEDDLATLQKNFIKKEKKFSKLQEQYEKSTSTLIDKEIQIKKIKTSFKTLLKVLVKFGTKLEAGKSANKKDKQLLKSYVEKLDNFSNDDDTVWNDDIMEEFSQSDLENSPQKQMTAVYQNNTVNNGDHQNDRQGYGNSLFDGISRVDFSDRKENVSVFPNHPSVSPNNFNENSSTLPVEDSVFSSNNQIKTDPEIHSFGEKNIYDSMQPAIHSNVNSYSQRNSEISTNSVGNSNIDFKKTLPSSVNDNFGLPTSSNGRINVSQDYLFKGYLKQPFAECQSNGDLPACDDGLDISIGDLDNLKQQICMTNDQFAPLSPLPPTPPPNNQKRTAINPAVKKSLNMNIDQSHTRNSSDRLSVPDRTYNPNIDSFVSQSKTAFDSSVNRDISGFNSSPPQFYSGKKPSLCHQQSEGFEVQKDATELQPDRFPNSQDTSYSNHSRNLVPSQERVPHRVSAKRCHDGSIKLDMNFQNNNFGAADFEVDVESGRISFVFCSPKLETAKITPSTFSPVVIRNAPNPISSIQKTEAFNTNNSVERKAPGFVESKVPSDMCHASSQNNSVKELDVPKENGCINSSDIGYGHLGIANSIKTVQKREHKQKTNLNVEHLSSANRENSSSPKSIVSSSGETSLSSKKKFIQRPDNFQYISLEHQKQIEAKKFKKPKMMDGSNVLASPLKVQELIEAQQFQNSNITITPIDSVKKVNKIDKMDIDNCISKSPDKGSMDISMPAPKSNLVQKRSSTLRKSNIKKFLSVSFVKAEDDNIVDISISKIEEKQENISNESISAETDKQCKLVPNKTSLMSKNKSKPMAKISSPKTLKIKKTKININSIKNEAERILESDKMESSKETELQLNSICQNNLVSQQIESPQSPVSIKNRMCGTANEFDPQEILNHTMPLTKVMKVTNIKNVNDEQLTNGEKLSDLAISVVESSLNSVVATTNEPCVGENVLHRHNTLNHDIHPEKDSNVAILKEARTKQVKGVKKLNNSRCKISLRSSHKPIHEPDKVSQEAEQNDFDKSAIVPQVIESPSSPMPENEVIAEHEKEIFDQKISPKKLRRVTNEKAAKTKQPRRAKKLKNSDIIKVEQNYFNNSVSHVIESPLSPVEENEVSESEKVTADRKQVFQNELIQQSRLSQDLSPKKSIKMRKTRQLKGAKKIKNSKSKQSLQSCDEPSEISEESGATKVQESDLSKTSVLPVIDENEKIESPLSPTAENVINKQVQGREKLNNSRSKLFLRSCDVNGSKTIKISEDSDITKVQENELNKNGVVSQEIKSSLSPMPENEKIITDQKDLFQDRAASKDDSETVLEQSSTNNSSSKTDEQNNSLLTIENKSIDVDDSQDTQVTDESINNDKGGKLIPKSNMCESIVNDTNTPDDKKETVSNGRHESYYQNMVNDDSSGDDMLIIAEDTSNLLSDIDDNSEIVNVDSSANGISEKTLKSGKRRKRKGKKKSKRIEKTIPKVEASPIVTALEVLDNLKFNDLHHKHYTHNLLCAILNPSNARSSDEAVLLILTHLASSKRNPMIPYMVSKDQSELLPLIESCIVSCLFEVDAKKKPHLNGLVKTTITALCSSILTKKMITVYGLASLCRVLCCMCKKMEDRKTPFNLCCSLLKTGHNLAPYLIASIVGIWPEVLTRQEWGQDSLFMRVIIYAIFKKPKLLTETLWKQCTTVLSDVCNISRPASLNTIETANKILGDIQSKEFGDDYIEAEACYTPLVILAVTEGWEWFENNLLHTYIKPIITELMHNDEHESQSRLNLFCNMFVDISLCAEKENNEAQVFWTALTSEIFTNSSGLAFSVQESLICALMRLYIMKEISLTKTLTDWLSEHQKSICEHKIALVYKSHHWKNSSDASCFRTQDFNLDKIT